MGTVNIVSASAGSGKTYRLAYEYIRNAIGNPSLYRNILAVTFTNKATAEMKRRIIGEINALAGGGTGSYIDKLEADLGLPPAAIHARAAEVRTKILHDYSRFTVLTIDKFFQRIIRSFIKELGIKSNFNLELQTGPILETATDRLIDDISADGELRDWVVRFSEEKIEENKRWDIKTELASLGQEIFGERYKTLSGAAPAKDELAKIVGEATGKSRAAADKMTELASQALKILERNSLTVDDFPYGKGSFVGWMVKVAAGEYEKYGKRVEDALSSDDRWYSKTSPRKEDIITAIPLVKPLLEELCSLYDSSLSLRNTAHLLRENFRSFALLGDLAARVEQICAEQNLMPISETNTILQKLIAGNDTPFIFEKVGNTFSHYMIDEFQDTSLQQWNNFVPLLRNAVAQSAESPVLLVGDVKQSIYRWRGGDWQILGGMAEAEFGAVEVKTLDTNFRSFSRIVDFNNTVIGDAVAIDNERLDDALAQAAETGIISAPTRGELTGMLADAYKNHPQKVNKGEDKGYVRVTEYPVPAEEDGGAAAPAPANRNGTAPATTGLTGRHSLPAAPPPSHVIRTVEELQERGYTPGEIAILVRYKSEGVRISAELLDRKAANQSSPYSYDVVTQEALTIGNSAVAGFIAAVMSLSANPENSIKKAVFNRFLGKTVNAELAQEEEKFIRSLRLVSLEEAFEEIIIRYSLNSDPDNIAYIQAMQEQVLSLGATKVSDISLFLKWWEETGAGESIKLPENPQAITIITIHKAKGLEYEAVIIPRCDWPLEPKTSSVVWAESEGWMPDLIGKVPVKYKKIMGDSGFAADFYREKVMSHIDNINTYYVAATRAVEELHILMPQKKNHGGDIGGLVLESMARHGEGFRKSAAGDGSVVYEYGTPIQHEKTTPQQTAPTEYPSRPIGAKLKFRLDAERYFGDGEAVALSPRSYGMIMHRIFENITDASQAVEQLAAMRTGGAISGKEMRNVENLIGRAFENPVIRSWFDGTWEVVRNENEIITPSAAGEVSAIRRPDRVLTKETEAVVIDYKFGNLKKGSYTHQVGEYMKLLSRMGYTTVSGYIWYVELDEIEAVGA